MERAVWDEGRFSVGDAIMDSQHSSIIYMINDLVSATEDSAEQEVRFALSSLNQYAVSHLLTEEELLKDRGYPELESHKVLHREYSEKISQFMSEQIIDKGTVLTFLVNWWSQHILVEDMAYKEFIRNK